MKPNKSRNEVRSWRDLPPTAKQMRFAAVIRTCINVELPSQITRGRICDFISENINSYKLQLMENRRRFSERSDFEHDNYADEYQSVYPMGYGIWE